MLAAVGAPHGLSLDGGRRRFAVLVLGDLGRSPRMQYHALALAGQGADVDLIGFAGSPLPHALRENRRIRTHLLPPPRLTRRHRLPRPLFLGYALLRAVHQATRLLWLLLIRLPAPSVLIVQNPPAVPTLLIVWLVARARAVKVVIDWHNFGYSMLALSVGHGHPAVRLARWYEASLGARADAHFCVSRAMQAELAAASGIAATVLYDRPAEVFGPTPPDARRDLFRRLENEIGFSSQGLSGSERPAILVSPTGWTADEDLSLLLAAVRECEARIAARASAHQRPFPQLLILITGIGPLRERYEEEIRAMVARNIHVRTLWLAPEDYVRLLGAADLGLCFHRSSSGLDLPMKVADMLGAGLPVCAFDYGPCLAEQIRHGENGLLFRTSAELAALLYDLFEGFPDEAPLLARLRQNLIRSDQPRWAEEWTAVAWPLLARLVATDRQT